jgi:hypothetical protein
MAMALSVSVSVTAEPEKGRDGLFRIQVKGFTGGSMADLIG